VVPAGKRSSRITSRVEHYYTINSFVKKSGDDDADPIKYFNALHASCSFYNIFCFYYIFDVICRLLRTVTGVLFNPN
jgi:hypothetical protein